MLLREILQSKSGEIVSIAPQASLEDVVQTLNRHRIGALVVCRDHDPCQMVGIITERDILYACAAGKTPLAEYCVEAHMTTSLITGTPQESIADAMGVMTQNRIRHLPILEEARLVGLISIGDLVKAQHDELATENYYLKEYIQG